MRKVKAGDKIRCTFVPFYVHWLTEGKVYTVLAAQGDDDLLFVGTEIMGDGMNLRDDEGDLIYCSGFEGMHGHFEFAED